MRLIILALVFALSGCATVGNKIDASQAEQFKDGVTTKEQVIALFGEPSGTSRLMNGDTMIHYNYVNINRPLAFVPIVGMLTTTKMESQNNSFLFGKDGKLKSSIGNQSKATSGIFSGQQ